jgi:hypothetical protein
MKLCKCGCGNIVKPGNTYINGHNKSTLGKIHKHKGKSYKEIYGEEKAKEIIDKLRKDKIGNGNLKNKDIDRQNKIEEKLSCMFLRIKDNINIEDLKKELLKI